jgi:hypothetical protein
LGILHKRSGVLDHRWPMLTLDEMSIYLDLERLRFFVDIILTIKVLGAIIERSSVKPATLRRQWRCGCADTVIRRQGFKSVYENILIFLQILSQFAVLLLNFRFTIFQLLI